MSSPSSGTVLGRGKIALVPIFSGLLAAVTVVLCYVISVHDHSVSPWPKTDITHTARAPPANYIFRWGMVEAMVILQGVWLATYVWLKAEATRVSVSTGSIHIAFILGVLGANLLILASVLIEPGDMDWSLHIFGATGFFVVTFFALVLTTNKMQQIKDRDPLAISNASMKFKWMDLFVLTGLLLTDVAGSSGFLPNRPYIGNVLEYLLTVFVLLWLSSLTFDWLNRLEIQLVLLPPQLPLPVDSDDATTTTIIPGTVVSELPANKQIEQL